MNPAQELDLSPEQKAAGFTNSIEHVEKSSDNSQSHSGMQRGSSTCGKLVLLFDFI